MYTWMGYLMHPTEWSSDFHGPPWTSLKKIPQKISGTLASSSVNWGSGIVKPSLPFSQKVVCSPLPCERQKRVLVSHRGGKAACEVLASGQTTQCPLLVYWKRCFLAKTANRQELPQWRKGFITDEILVSLGFADKPKWIVSNALRGEG